MLFHLFRFLFILLLQSQTFLGIINIQIFLKPISNKKRKYSKNQNKMGIDFEL